MMQNKNQKTLNLVKSANQIKSENILLKAFDDLFHRYGHYFLFFLIALIIAFVFKDFIILKKIYLFKDAAGSDSINISYPSYYSLANYIANEGIPKWSFNQGMGQNIFPSGLSDPFSLFIIMMGKNLVYYSIFYAELLKILCAGLFFYLFLKKIDLSDYTVFIGTILYSFSGFIILGGQWGLFSTQAVYVALLLYSFEKLYKDNNWILFPLCIFLIASNQPLDLYIIGLFFLIYVIFRLFETNEKEPKKIIVLFKKIFILGMIGIAISAFFSIHIFNLIESPRISGNTSYFNLYYSRPIFGFEYSGKTHYLTSFMRLFSCNILGTGNNFKGWWNYLEAPLFYCGLISLVTFPHFLSLSDRRKKIIYLIWILIFLVPVIFPFFRNSFWLYTGNYYRIFSLFVAIVILLIGLKSIDNIDCKSEANIKIIIATLLFLLFFLYYPYKNAQIINKDIRNTVAIFLIIYSALIYLIQFKNIKNIVKIALLSLIVIELIYAHNATINKRPVISGKEIVKKVGYNDYTVDSLAFIKLNDKTFFRINKDYSSGTSMNKSLNDAQVQDFYGTSSYHSFNQSNYIKFLQTLEIINMDSERDARWSLGLTRCPLLHSFASIKYALSKDQDPYLLKFGYDLIEKRFGDVKVLKNKFFLPLGFTYENYISLKDFKSLSQNQKMITLYKAVVIDDSIYNSFGNVVKFDLSGMSDNYWEKGFEKDVERLSQDTLKISEHGQNKIKGEINVDKDKILLFSIPFDKGWNIKIDGKRITPMMVNIGFIGVPVEKGSHRVELSFIPLYFYTGAIISFIAIVLFICLLTFKHLRDKKAVS